MNQFFIETVIQDREREVAKYPKYNQLLKDARESAGSLPESTERGKNILILRFSEIAKWLKRILALKNERSVKA